MRMYPSNNTQFKIPLITSFESPLYVHSVWGDMSVCESRNGKAKVLTSGLRCCASSSSIKSTSILSHPM
jgi:hypothetical protein